jgi:hypothetical protein
MGAGACRQVYKTAETDERQTNGRRTADGRETGLADEA